MRAWAPRLLAIALAVLGAFWGVMTLPIFWQARVIGLTADLIVRSHRFATQAVAAEAAKADSAGLSPSVAARRSLAILKLRLAEDALNAGDRLSLKGRLADLKRSTADVLEIEPSDAFFWLVYYWCDLNTEGFRPANLKFLQASYELGPNEGWIAIRRNRLALAAFSELSPDMSERVLSEFTGMVASGLIVDAASNLIGPGAPLQSVLLGRLTAVPIAERERLARYLEENGVDLAVPGVERTEKRFY